jgi:hypothetical protein
MFGRKSFTKPNHKPKDAQQPDSNTYVLDKHPQPKLAIVNVVERKDQPDKREYYHFDSVEDLLQYADTITKKQLNLHEYVYENMARKPMLDIDISIDSLKQVHEQYKTIEQQDLDGLSNADILQVFMGEKKVETKRPYNYSLDEFAKYVIDTFAQNLCFAVQDYYKAPEINDEDAVFVEHKQASIADSVVFTRHRENKYSAHIIVYTHYVQNSAQMKELFEHFIALTKQGDPMLVDAKFGFVDDKTTHSSYSMSMPYATNKGQALTHDSSANFSAELFRKGLLTNVQSAAPLTKLQGVKQATNNNDLTQVSSELAKECIELLMCKYPNVANSHAYRGIRGSFINFDCTNRTQPCLICNRTHDSEHYLMMRVSGNNAYVHCRRAPGKRQLVGQVGKTRITHEDPYVFQDFKQQYSTTVFNSRAQLMSQFKRDANRVLAQLSSGKGCYIKKDNCQEQLYIACEKIAGAVIDFAIAYKVNRGDLRQDQQQDLEKLDKLKQKRDETKSDNAELIKLNKDISKLEKQTNKFGVGNIARVMLSELVVGNLNEYVNLVNDPDEPQGSYNLNVWTGFQARKRPVDMAKIQEVLEFIRDDFCNNDDAVYKAMLDYFAFMVQKPGKKSKIALVCISAQGTGKGTLCEFLEYVLGKQLIMMINEVESVAGAFNAHLSGRKLVVLDDAACARDDFRGHWSKMKNLITEPTYMHHQKFATPVLQKNILEFIIFSNNRDSVIIESSDRRYLVVEMNGKHKQDKKWFGQFRKNNMNQDVADHFYSYLMERQIEDYIDVPMTELKQEMQAVSKTSQQKFTDHLLEQMNLPIEDRDVAYQELDKTKLKSSEIYTLYSNWCETNGENKVSAIKLGLVLSLHLQKKTIKGIGYYGVK